MSHVQPPIASHVGLVLAFHLLCWAVFGALCTADPMPVPVCEAGNPAAFLLEAA